MAESLPAPVNSLPITDGRLLRSERSRVGIADSLLSLLREGNTNPSSTEIAERAGVTQRTVFNHYADMDTLMLAVAVRNGDHILPLVPDVPPTGPVEARIESFGAATCRVLEDSQHIRWAILTHPSGERFGGLAVQFMRNLMRERLQCTFTPELDRYSDDRRSEIVDMLEVEIDPLVWRLRRQQNGLSFDVASACVRRAFTVLLSQ